MNEVYQECYMEAAQGALKDHNLYKRMLRLRNHLVMSLKLRVSVQIVLEDGSTREYEGVTRHQPVDRLITHTLTQNGELQRAYVFQHDGAPLALAASSSPTWNDLMLPWHTRVVITRKRRRTRSLSV